MLCLFSISTATRNLTPTTSSTATIARATTAVIWSSFRATSTGHGLSQKVNTKSTCGDALSQMTKSVMPPHCPFVRSLFTLLCRVHPQGLGSIFALFMGALLRLGISLASLVTTTASMQRWKTCVTHKLNLVYRLLRLKLNLHHTMIWRLILMTNLLTSIFMICCFRIQHHLIPQHPIVDMDVQERTILT